VPSPLGNAAVCLNVHFDGLFAYFLHFAPKTSKRTIDDLYDAAFESLLMFSHTTIRFLYGARGPGFGKLASIISARSVILQSVGLILAAIAGGGPKLKNGSATESLPRPADGARQHAGAGRAFAVGRVRPLSPRGCIVERFGDDVPVPAFGPRMVCTSCGIIGVFARPNWQERPTSESLTERHWH
jgi:hypothetical protein